MPKADFKSAAFTNFATPALSYFPMNTTGCGGYWVWTPLERFGNEREIAHTGRNTTPEIVPKSVHGVFQGEHRLREAGRSPITAAQHTIPGAHNAHFVVQSHANLGE